MRPSLVGLHCGGWSRPSSPFHKDLRGTSRICARARLQRTNVLYAPTACHVPRLCPRGLHIAETDWFGLRVPARGGSGANRDRARERSIGGSYLHISDSLLNVNSAPGWNASFAGNPTIWLGIVGDATGH